MKAVRARADNLNVGDIFLRGEFYQVFGVIGFDRDDKGIIVNARGFGSYRLPDVEVPASEVVKVIDPQELVNNYPNKIR